MQLRFQKPDLHAYLVQRSVMGNLMIDQEVAMPSFPVSSGTVGVVAICEWWTQD